MKEVSIIIPVFNNIELLKKILPRVIEVKGNSDNRVLEIIIVDDASVDNTYDYIKKEFPEVTIIRHRVNRGFSASINTGARSAKGKILSFLNSDVIPMPDFLKPVFKHFKNERVFGVSLHEKGYFWARGYFKDGFVGHAKGYKGNTSQETFWVNGGSGVFRRDYWMKLGGFDEKLFSPYYWEDIDLCYRAAKRGYVNIWEPDANVIHEHESTIRKLSKKYVERIRERNQLLFIWKNITSPNLFRKHLIGLFQRILRHPGYSRIVILALMKSRLIRKARRKEKKEARVSDEAIFAKFQDK